MAVWTRRDNEGFIAWEATRPDNTYMAVSESIDSTSNYPLWDVYVRDADDTAEFYMGEIEDTTVESCKRRAEGVRLPEDRTD